MRLLFFLPRGLRCEGPLGILWGSFLLLQAPPVLAKTPLRVVHEKVQKLLQDPSSTASTRQALKLLRYGIRLFPEAESLRRLKGIAAFRQGDLNTARQAFQNALERDPTTSFNALKLASLEICAAGRPEAGRHILSDLFRRHPGDTALQVQAAEMLRECGQPEGAIHLWLGLARSHSKDAWRYQFKAAQLYFQGAAYENSRTLLRKALETCPPNQAEPAAQLGAVYARLGDPTLARRWFLRALERHPKPALEMKLREQLRLLSD
jgi:tetratricopeptide (TPR) repeat protein